MQQNRLNLARARHDTCDWVQERRARTRQLIELGGLVQKAGLIELLDDDRATLLGALLDITGQLRGASDKDPAHLRLCWRRAGLRVFAAEHDMVDSEKKERGMAGEGAALPAPESFTS